MPLAEVLFHRERQYLEIGWNEPDEVAYDDCLANFDAAFHDIRHAEAFRDCLDPGSYAVQVQDALVNAGTATWTGDVERRLDRVPPVVKSGFTKQLTMWR